jgi:glutamate-1-semialdehyde 2,1-aminomutase
MTERTFEQSARQLERAERVIPLGSQTFSKSRTQYPLGVSPLFIERAKGSRVWDVDGNEYVDFVSSLLSVTLGYGDPDVTDAVRAQLEGGVIFSLPHPLETEVAELIVEMVPCAEQVRFGKNGSDATAGAIRLARAYTGRDRVCVSGYHGWQDWYIGSTARSRGVPEATRQLTHPFPYNNLDALEALFREHRGEIAAVIMEPMNVEWPLEGFLEGVQEICRREGAVLIFDETITGFRFAPGGAQELFGVTPDLACFGKGLANGYPISAIAGRRDLMKLMEEVFFSFTFGGEMLSLSAAKATLLKLKREPVTQRMAEMGDRLLDRIPSIVAEHELDHVFAVKGHPSWTFLTIADADGAGGFDIKTLLMQELHQRGFLSIGTHNLNYAHSDADIEGLLGAYSEIFPQIAAGLHDGDLDRRIKGERLVPLFKVR